MINSHYAYDYVYEEILNELKRKGKENISVLPSEKEYCKRFDVSLTTVRRALDRLYREKIIVKIKGKGSVISDKVRCLKVPPNKFIGVLMVTFDDIQNEKAYESKYHYINPYAQKIYRSVYNELGDEYNLLIDTMEPGEVEKKFPSSILNRADKIFIVGEMKRGILDYLYSLGKYVIVYNYFEKEVSVARVNNDERLCFRNMTEWFIRRGHTRIACINGVNFLSETIERYMGFQDAMITNGIYIENRYIKWGNMTPESGYYLTKELLSLPEPPEVIVCVNDGVAMGAYDAATEAGLTVGKDVFLSGHDNEMPDDKYLVSTIDPDYDGIGKEIAAVLRRETWIDDEIIHPGKLIIR